MGRGPRAPSYLTPTMRLCGRVCPTNGPAWGILAARFILAGRRGGPFLRLMFTSFTGALFLTAIYLDHPCFAGWHAHAKGSRVLLWRVYSNVPPCPALGTICSVKRTQHIPKRLVQVERATRANTCTRAVCRAKTQRENTQVSLRLHLFSTPRHNPHPRLFSHIVCIHGTTVGSTARGLLPGYSPTAPRPNPSDIGGR